MNFTFVLLINFIVFINGTLSAPTQPQKLRQVKLRIVTKGFTAQERLYLDMALQLTSALARYGGDAVSNIFRSDGSLIVPEAVETFIGHPEDLKQKGDTRLSKISLLTQSVETRTTLSDASNVVNIMKSDAVQDIEVINQGRNDKDTANVILLGHLFFSPRIPPTKKLYYIVGSELPVHLLAYDLDAYDREKHAFDTAKKAGHISSTAIFKNFPMPISPSFTLLRAFQYSDAITVHGLSPKDDNFRSPMEAASLAGVPLEARAMNWALVAYLSYANKPNGHR